MCHLTALLLFVFDAVIGRRRSFPGVHLRCLLRPWLDCDGVYPLSVVQLGDGGRARMAANQPLGAYPFCPYYTLYPCKVVNNLCYSRSEFSI